MSLSTNDIYMVRTCSLQQQTCTENTIKMVFPTEISQSLFGI